ncbi:MAG: hypothetical protein ACLTSX_02590 [Collinsella sp.]
MLRYRALTSQRRAFDTAIRGSCNNWYRLMMRNLRPQPRRPHQAAQGASSPTAASWRGPMQERMREKHQCNIPYADPARPHERLQPALHGLLGG